MFSVSTLQGNSIFAFLPFARCFLLLAFFPPPPRLSSSLFNLSKQTKQKQHIVFFSFLFFLQQSAHRNQVVGSVHRHPYSIIRQKKIQTGLKLDTTSSRLLANKGGRSSIRDHRRQIPKSVVRTGLEPGTPAR